MLLLLSAFTILVSQSYFVVTNSNRGEFYAEGEPQNMSSGLYSAYIHSENTDYRKIKAKGGILVDFDLDGDLDLTYGYSDSYYFKNDGGVYEDITDEYSIDNQGICGMVAGDIDNNGYKDILKWRFQEYDPSREETRVDSYYDNLEAVRVGGSAKTGAARKKSQATGKGFAGMGAREAGVEDTLSSLMGAQERAGEKEYRGLFEDIRGMREDYMKDITGQLYDLDSAEGTIEADSPEYDPANNPPGYEGYGEPSDGASYTDTNGENWVYDGMANQWKKEQGE